MKPRYLAAILLLLVSCGAHDDKVATIGDSLKPEVAQPAHMPSQVDSTIAHARQDSSTMGPKSNLPPIATPISTDRLATFLPKMDGYTAGELQQETRLRTNYSSSKVGRTYTLDGKKITVEINDFAYVPFLYEPFIQYQDKYLEDNNDERTETTTLAGFHAVQTWGKKDFSATIYVFPGKRFVVKLVGDGLKSIEEARAILETMDLKSLEATG